MGQAALRKKELKIKGLVKGNRGAKKLRESTTSI
jgi:hypothetical protein